MSQCAYCGHALNETGTCETCGQVREYQPRPNKPAPESWHVEIVHHDKQQKMEHDFGSFMEMMTCIVVPIGPALNRNTDATMTVSRNGRERIKILLIPE